MVPARIDQGGFCAVVRDVEEGEAKQLLQPQNFTLEANFEIRI